MTFKKYIIGFIKDESCMGDLARDVESDDKFPEGEFENKKHIYDYLVSQNACDAALEVFDKAWFYYSQN